MKKIVVLLTIVIAIASINSSYAFAKDNTISEENASYEVDEVLQQNGYESSIISAMSPDIKTEITTA